MQSTDYDPAVLIIAYRRHQNLENILDICAKNLITRIYIALDGPKDGHMDGVNDYIKSKDVIRNFENRFTGQLKFLIRDYNVGCAPSVIAACEWVFGREECVIVLEDDCIPVNSFFDFSRRSLEFIISDESIWLSCGTQFVPQNFFDDSWILSKYPLNWGWTTTNTKWKLIQDCILNPKSSPILRRLSVQGSYWEAGNRRASEGWVDVWDTILVHQMILRGKLAILPSTSLISNIGADHVATNTKSANSIPKFNLGEFTDPVSRPYFSKLIEKKLREEVFQIRKRHLISTRITYLKDRLTKKRNKYGPLNERVKPLLGVQMYQNEIRRQD